MATPTAAQVWRDYVTDGVSATGAHDPEKRDIRAWAAAVETALGLVGSMSGLVYQTRAALYADLAHAANSAAWVVADTTAAYNGIYAKSGVSGTGSWARVADLPYSLISGTDAGGSTANAMQVATPVPVSESALIRFPWTATNTSISASVTFNGGSALSIKTNSGANPAVGGLYGGTILLGMISGTTFRLVSDEASASIQAAAEAARDAAAISAASAAASAASAVVGIIDHTVTPAKLALGAWTTVASATTVDLGAQTGRNIVISGSTAITSFGSTATADNVPFHVRFTGALVLTRSASLETPTGQSITTAAGDAAVIVQDTTGYWRIVSYVRASGMSLAVGPGAGQLVARDANGLVGGIVQSAAVATTSGVSIDVVGIPATAKRVTIAFAGVSTSGNSMKGVQIGSGSVDASGYLASVGWLSASQASTTMFPLPGTAAVDCIYGILTLQNIGSNSWVAAYSGTIKVGSDSPAYGGGFKVLSGALDRIRLTTSGGTDTFDAGSLTVTWE